MWKNQVEVQIRKCYCRFHKQVQQGLASRILKCQFLSGLYVHLAFISRVGGWKKNLNVLIFHFIWKPYADYLICTKPSDSFLSNQHPLLATETLLSSLNIVACSIWLKFKEENCHTDTHSKWLANMRGKKRQGYMLGIKCWLLWAYGNHIARDLLQNKSYNWRGIQEYLLPGSAFTARWNILIAESTEPFLACHMA